MESDRSVGIVTIVDDANFGNRLQNYALQQVIRRLGWFPETIRNTPPRMPRRLVLSRVGFAVRRDPLEFVRRNGRLLATTLASRANRHQQGPPRFAERRRRAIASFAERTIQMSPDAYEDRAAASWGERYGRVITGSDQVWNPGFRHVQGLDFLDFAPYERRIAYAASFGIPEIPEYLHARYRDWLSGIPHLSVREERGAEIVAELTGRQVPVVLDPTLLADRSIWDALLESVDTPVPESPYAVRFFLGEPSADQAGWVQGRVRDQGLTLLDLNDLEQEDFADLDPIGFIDLLSKASLVLTDSFHASVFSLLYGRELVLRDRHPGDARLRTLVNLHGLAMHSTGVAGLTTVDLPGSEAASRRESHRARSLEFLTNALGTLATED